MICLERKAFPFSEYLTQSCYGGRGPTLAFVRWVLNPFLSKPDSFSVCCSASLIRHKTREGNMTAHILPLKYNRLMFVESCCSSSSPPHPRSMSRVELRYTDFLILFK